MKRETPPRDGGGVGYNVAATYFPTSVRGSIIGPPELNGRVRDGNGCDLRGIATTKAVIAGFVVLGRVGESWDSRFKAKPEGLHFLNAIDR